MAKAFSTALQLMGRAAKPVQGGTLPIDLVADTLNKPDIETHRASLDDGVRVHVSELITPEKSRIFCPRNKSLQYFYGKRDFIASNTPGMSLLYYMGNAIHDHIRHRTVNGSAYGMYMYGKWTCLCKKATHIGCLPDKLRRANVCKNCKTPTINYEEIELYDPVHFISGHPDLLFKYAKKFYLYELKSLDRKTVPFDSLQAPLGDHVLQASFYYWIMNSLGMDVHSNIRFVYADRSTQHLFSGINYKEFRVKRSPITRLAPFLAKAKEFTKSIDTKILPNRICDKVDCTRAKNCSLATLCFSKVNNEIKIKKAV